MVLSIIGNYYLIPLSTTLTWVEVTMSTERKTCMSHLVTQLFTDWSEIWHRADITWFHLRICTKKTNKLCRVHQDNWTLVYGRMLKKLISIMVILSPPPPPPPPTLSPPRSPYSNMLQNILLVSSDIVFTSNGQRMFGFLLPLWSRLDIKVDYNGFKLWSLVAAFGRNRFINVQNQVNTTFRNEITKVSSLPVSDKHGKHNKGFELINTFPSTCQTSLLSVGKLWNKEHEGSVLSCHLWYLKWTSKSYKLELSWTDK